MSTSNISIVSQTGGAFSARRRIVLLAERYRAELDRCRFVGSTLTFIQHVSNFARQHVRRKWLLKKWELRVQHTVMDNCVLGISGDEKHFERRIHPA